MVWTPPTASSPVYLHAYLDGAGLVSDPQGPLFRHHSHNRQRLSPAIGSLGNYILRLFDRQLSSRKNSPGRRSACASGPICWLVTGGWHGLAGAGSEPAV